MQTGRHAELKATLQRVEDLGASAPVLDGLASARIEQIRGFRALRAGDPGAARDGYAAAVAAFEQAGNVREGCIQRVNVGFTSLLLGDFEHAEEVLRQLAATAERMGLQTVAGYAHLNLGHVLLQLGRPAEARESEERGRAIGLSTGAPRMAGAALVHLANIAYGEGDYATAEALAADGADTLTVAPPLRAGAIASRARALLALGRTDEALALAREALAIVEAGMNDMFDSLVRLVHAEALEASGDREGARAAIGEARRLLLEAADRIADPTLRKSFLERVPVNAATLAMAAANAEA
jgi:tetratricopeptide (TPR) repeat protein